VFVIRVLFVSPQDPDVPGDLKFLMGGENTYTRTLLANPPKGVIYTHHLDALSRGLVEYTVLQRLLSIFVKFRILPLSSGSQCLKIIGEFDLVHAHCYSVQITGKKLPVVLSDSSSNYLFLRDYLNWPEWRIRIGYFLRRKIFGLLGLMDADTNVEKAKRLIVFSKFSSKVHIKLGARAQKIELIPPGLLLPKMREKKNDGRIKILFVGIWFERKGGHLLLQAYKKLSKKFANLELTVIGPMPKKYKIEGLNINHKDYVPRERLLREYFPNTDILVLVPPKAEGFGFVVLEAASFGIPTIVSDVYALPEIVENAKTGFVIQTGNSAQLVEKLEVLINDSKLRLKFGEQARRRFRQKFSTEIMQKKLVVIYKDALKS